LILLLLLTWMKLLVIFPHFFFVEVYFYLNDRLPTFSCFIPSALEIRFRVVLHQCIPHT
jgi:hypothetical protein